MEARCFGFRGKHGAPAGAAAAGVFGCAEAADVMQWQSGIRPQDMLPSHPNE
jgi:hypothetical protein